MGWLTPTAPTHPPTSNPVYATRQRNPNWAPWQWRGLLSAKSPLRKPNPSPPAASRSGGVWVGGTLRSKAQLLPLHFCHNSNRAENKGPSQSPQSLIWFQNDVLWSSAGSDYKKGECRSILQLEGKKHIKVFISVKLLINGGVEPNHRPIKCV